MKARHKIFKARSLWVLGFGVIAVFLVYGADAQIAQVKVIPDSNVPRASLVSLQNTEELFDSLSCRPAGYLNTYYKESGKDAYDADNAKTARCVTGYLTATVLEQKIAGLSASIAEMDKRLVSLANTGKYLNGFSAVNLNGLSLAAIPAGIDEPVQFETAKNIAERCVKDTSTGMANPAVAVGDKAVDSLSLFNPVPEMAIKKMQEVRNNTQKMKNLLLKFVKPGLFKGFGSFLNDSLAADVDANIEMMGQMLALAIVNQKIATEYAMSLTVDDLQKNYQPQVAAGNYLITTLHWQRKDEKGRPIKKKIVEDTPPLLGHMRRALEKQVPLDKMPKTTTRMDITVGDIQFTARMPEADVYNELKAAVANNIAKYNVMKANYGAIMKTLQGQLNTLVSNEYNCP